MFWLILVALIGLIFSQTYIIMQGARVQQAEFEENFYDLLLDIHHNVEDDEYLSNILIGILRNADKGLAQSDSLVRTARSELRTRIDSISENYGINLPFDFVIFNTHDHQYYFKSSDKIKQHLNFQEKSIKAGWRIKEALGEGKYRIGLHFYNEFIYILLQLKFILMLSLAIVLLIAFGFWRTIKGWKEQKELVALKNDFINNLTHELKTPIFSVSLLHKVIKKKLNGQPYPQLHKHLDLLEQENHKLKERVEKVLDVALMENQQLQLDLTLAHLHRLIPDAIRMLQFTAEQQHGTIKLDLWAEHDLVNVDKVHFSNVVYNLVDNAIKYSDKPPEILLTTRSDQHHFYLIIKDNGIGIDKEFIEQVFDKFYRIPTGNIHKVKGFGLGLSYTRMMVVSHGGKIKVKSAPHQGSEFIIKLPLDKMQNG